MSSFAQSSLNEVAQFDAPPIFLHQFFERTVRQWPEHIAIEVPPGNGHPERRRVTYAELEQEANALAAFLRQFVTKECIVAILLPRNGVELYLSQLATLKAGAAYTCLDPVFPDEQVRDIFADAEAVAVLTDTAGTARAIRCGFDPHRVFNVAELMPRLDRKFLAPPDWLTPGNLAYIIYTSGTTGRPKGVMIEHRGIVNLVAHDIEEFRLTPDERISQNSSSAYDSSVEETWFAFAAGATLVVMDEETARLGPDLVPWLRRERITLLCPPPTLLRTLGSIDPMTELPELSFVYVGGEALPTDVAERWAKGRRLENGYGPTECTVTATHTRIFEGDPITIGRPIRGLQAWVLDEALKEVPDGEQGELCLSGVGLARGYRNRPELTAQKFPTHPRLGRIYRTGDLVSRAADGKFFYHGRIDSQVKLRGYRIELEAIEARLAECEGVREAACRVQGEGPQQLLAAFIVPEAGLELSFDALKTSLRTVLPPYMVPSRFTTIGALPRSVGGKLERKSLPVIAAEEPANYRELVAPRTPMEEKLTRAFREVLRLSGDISIHDDFFNVLGGDSLNAAVLTSLLRDDPSMESVTVRDLYETRTVAELAKRLMANAKIEVTDGKSAESEEWHGKGRPILATAAQTFWLVTELVLGSASAYLVGFELLPALLHHLSLISFLLLSPLLFFMALLLYTPFAVLFVAGLKKVLIGKYRPLRAPIWGSFYVRNWIMQQAVRIVPWQLIEGTVFQIFALRALGAHIGERVHIHRGVNLLQGGWDLLEIGDDVTISQDASLRLVDLDDGCIVVGAVSLGEGSTLEVRSGVGTNAVLEPGAYLTASSFLQDGERISRGERWDGIFAAPAGQAPPRPLLTNNQRILSPFQHGIMLILSRTLLGLILALPIELPALVFAIIYGVDAETAATWIFHPSVNLSSLIIALLLVTLSAPVTLAVEAVAARAIGTVHAGIISRWSLGYARVWLKTQLVLSAGEWLSGTLFWPVWLRLAGMKIGRGCEISTITDVVPELVEIGPETFFADGIYLCGPRVHRGTVTLAATRLGTNTFLGNHVVIPNGQQLPDDILIGVSTVADDKTIRPGTSWFGHPLFELPRREIVECDRSLTHNPSWIRYINRVFWELLRFTLPVVPTLILPVWFELLDAAEPLASFPVFLFGVVPLVSFGLAAFFCLLVLALKWLLLGRVRPGIHPLWSCWCSRWDFLYVAWAFYARPALSALEGSLLLSWYLRAMGIQIGRRVALAGGFSHVVDPDMLHFEDDATVSCQFQAHTFEDRVLKIDHVHIRRRATVAGNAVLLYGADIGEETNVAPHSVVMKRESLLPKHRYAGCPTRPVANSSMK